MRLDWCGPHLISTHLVGRPRSLGEEEYGVPLDVGEMAAETGCPERRFWPEGRGPALGPVPEARLPPMMLGKRICYTGAIRA